MSTTDDLAAGIDLTSITDPATAEVAAALFTQAAKDTTLPRRLRDRCRDAAEAAVAVVRAGHGNGDGADLHAAISTLVEAADAIRTRACDLQG